MSLQQVSSNGSNNRAYTDIRMNGRYQMYDLPAVLAIKSGLTIHVGEGYHDKALVLKYMLYIM